ncbi:hypothetical protein JZO70_01875 [Enterococcus sp. 669A]|uniref:Uncharacterized protein n=1 Tax=Candidatus Enterococcus moelleringii TaxID=2815325 RepID=A0ABS3L8Y2_9ENTE|nr:hypothetical protein [Enterococcus sp. 669A]MBO1304894.1 hypothetical protein [Enterococcus sp. 669A]
MKAKKKKQLKAQFIKESPLFQLKKETRSLIKKGENPYFLALDCLYHRYHYTHFGKSDKQLMEFMERYLLDFLDPASYPIREEQLLHEMAYYQQLLETYYLFKNDSDAFQKSIEWTEDIFADQLETIKQWPERFVLSVFAVKKEDQGFYFIDVRNQKKYLIQNVHVQNLKRLAARKLQVLALIVPIGENYISTPPMICEPDQIILEVFKKASDEKAPLDIIQWYTGTIHDQLIEDNDFEEFDRLAELDAMSEGPDWEAIESENPPFYSAMKEPGETSESLARRMLAQDKTLDEFIYKEQMLAFLVQIIDRYPQMFFARSNAFSITEALRDVFTDEDIDDEQFEIYSNFASLFWHSFLEENMPEEIKKIEKYQVSKDYWFEQFMSY